MLFAPPQWRQNVDTQADSSVLQLVGSASLMLGADIPPLSLALMEILAQRPADPELSSRQIPLGQLSRLLWTAADCKVQSATGRMAAAPCQDQDIAIYVALAEGLYLLEGPAMRLLRVSDQDVRTGAGMAGGGAEAPVDVVYVARTGANAAAAVTAALCVGRISQNVILFCAAEGLTTLAPAGVDRSRLTAALALAPGQQLMLVQSVGYCSTPQAPASRCYDS
jgi:hypothetical protein